MRSKITSPPDYNTLVKQAFIMEQKQPAAATMLMNLIDAFLAQGKRAKAAEDQIVVLERELDYLAPQPGRPQPGLWYWLTRRLRRVP